MPRKSSRRDGRPQNGPGSAGSGPDSRRGRGGDRPRRPLSPPRGPARDRDTWRPREFRNGGGGPPPPRHPPSRPYSDRDRNSDRHYAPPQGDFSFRMDKPAGVGESGPGPSRPDPRRNNRRGGPGRPGRPRWRPPHPSERALISGATLNMPEERLESAEGGPNKFRDLGEVSDDEELDMDISSHASDSESNEPSKKRQKTEGADDDDSTASAEAAPKWSNPDPYTALPCPDESQKKKRDVVKLIRKARVEAEHKTATPGQAEDFISFDLTEDDDDSETSEESESDYEPPPPMPPGQQQPASNGIADRAPPTGPSDPLGSRKRTIDDEIKPPNYGQLGKKGGSRPPKGSVVGAWLPKKSEESCPWAIDHGKTGSLAFRLHKEVMDFYEYVRPRDFEQRIRDNLVDNLRRAMRRDGRNFASAHAFPFGSFMSGLYLPTADMDIVVCSASFMRGGPPTYLGAKSWLYKFQKFLVAQQLADPASIQVIAHARIPLVKFVDKFTGLRVDVSFENLGGVDAIDTFLKWKKEYPAMPILVTVIKHFLLMRGLNEPVNGGIGGFSVICLVVSMLQLMPQVQSRSLVPEHHLGEMLLEFFDLYGSQFNFEVNAISLTRPVGYIRKSDVRSFVYKSTDRLSIIDPNNPGNDISGGSSNAAAIFDRFHDAYMALCDRMKEVAKPSSSGGILDAIMQGDYSSFRMQRGYLKRVHEQHVGPCSE